MIRFCLTYIVNGCLPYYLFDHLPILVLDQAGTVCDEGLMRGAGDVQGEGTVVTWVGTGQPQLRQDIGNSSTHRDRQIWDQ